MANGTLNNMKAEITTALIVGVGATLSAIVKQNGRNFTPDEKTNMRNRLKQRLLDEFKPYFIEANIARPEAIAIVSQVVDTELAKY